MSYNSEVLDFSDLANEVTNAISDLNCEQICELRNKLVPSEVAFVQDGAEFRVYALADIEEWATRIDLSYTRRTDVNSAPVHFELNHAISSERYESEREAMIAAFEEIVVNEEDLSTYDLFQCESCKGYFDIEESVEINDNDLHCESCASKNQNDD